MSQNAIPPLIQKFSDTYHVLGIYVLLSKDGTEISVPLVEKSPLARIIKQIANKSKKNEPQVLKTSYKGEIVELSVYIDEIVDKNYSILLIFDDVQQLESVLAHWKRFRPAILKQIDIQKLEEKLEAMEVKTNSFQQMLQKLNTELAEIKELLQIKWEK